jgi:hypothetical protein
MKNAVCLVLVVLVILFASAIPGYTVDRGASHGGGGPHGGGDGRGGGDWHGGGDGRGGGDWHGGGDHHGGGDWHGSIWIGPGWGGWGGWGTPYYPYYDPYYPYYRETPAVIQQQPPVYVQPEEQYWYFCRNPEGYYPYIKKCPGGWLKVVPPVPPDEKE